MEEKKVEIGAVIGKIKEVWSQVKRRKWLILAVSLLLAAFLYFRESRKPIYYTSAANFILESDDITNDGASLMQSSSVLTTLFGAEKTNRDILLALFASNKMKELTLLTEGEVDGKKDLLINHLSRISNSLNESNTFDSSFEYGKDERKDAYLRARANAIKPPNFKSGPSDDGTLYINFKHTNQDFAFCFVENHFKAISDYYTNKRLEKAKKYLDYAEKHREEVRQKLASAEYGIAQILDKNRFAVMNRALAEKSKLERKVYVYNEMYLNAEVSYQAARANVLKKTPYVQIIDDVRKPLPRTYNHPIKQAIIGFIIGLILITAIVIGLYFVKDVYNKQIKPVL